MMTIRVVSSRLFYAARTAWLLPITVLSACSGSGNANPPIAATPTPIAASPSPSTTPSPQPSSPAAPTFAPTTPPLSGLVTPTPLVYTLPASGGIVTIGGSGAGSATVTFPSSDAPAGTTVSLYAETVRSDQTSGSYTEENVHFTLDHPVTFSSFGPSYSIVPPASTPAGANLQTYFFDATSNAVYVAGAPVATCGSSVYVPGRTLDSFAANAGDSYSMNLVVDFGSSAASMPTCPP